MPRLTIAVEMIAAASTPGVRNCTPPRPGANGAAIAMMSTPAGMMSVRSRLSPRRSVISSSARVCARMLCRTGAACGAASGADAPDGVWSVIPASPSR
jgi:hypothetical protein